MLSLVASYLNDIELDYNVMDSLTWTLDNVQLDSKRITLVVTSSANGLIELMKQHRERTKSARTSVRVKLIHSVNTKLFSPLSVRDIERLARHLNGVSKHEFRAFRIEYPFIPLPALTLSDILLDTTAPLHRIISLHTRTMLKEAHEDLFILKQHAIDVDFLPYLSGSLTLNRAMKQFTEQVGRCYYLQDQFWTLLWTLDAIGGNTLCIQWLEILTRVDDKLHLELLNDMLLCLPLYSCTKDRFNSE